VGNRQYQIASLDEKEFNSKLETLEVSHADIRQAKSFIDYDEQIICIRKSLKSDHKQELVLHELLHACLEDAGLDQSDTTETFIRVLSPRLSALMSEIRFNLDILE
jgi:Zn-dependent peptidase ImmA (M78 family)